MAAPVAGPQPPLTSGAADSTYNENLATIEHGENNLYGGNYGKTGEIGGELGKAIGNIREGEQAQIGAYGTTGVIGGSLGRGEGERTRTLSARAGANTQSGLYGTERGNVIQGFGERATGIERNARIARERQEDRARTAYEGFQAQRAKNITGADRRYEAYVAKNPAAPPPPTNVAQGFGGSYPYTYTGPPLPGFPTGTIITGPPGVGGVLPHETPKVRVGPKPSRARR